MIRGLSRCRDRLFRTSGALAVLVVGLCISARGAPEHALVFQGAKPHVEIAEEAAFDLTQALTVEAWVWFDPVPANQFAPKWQAIVTKGDAWGLTRHSNVKRIAFRTHDGTSIHSLSTPADFEAETWYHVAGVFDGTTKSLYVNGILVNSAPWTGPIATNMYHVLIGGNEEFATRAFAGRIDTVRIWSVARSSSDVAAVMQRHVLGSEEGLLGTWRFDEAPQTAAVPDTSRNAYDGQLREMAYTPDRVPGITFGSPPTANRSLSFSGTNEHVELAREQLFDFTTAMAVEAWVYSRPSAAAALLVEDRSQPAWTDVTASGSEQTANDTRPFGSIAADTDDAFYIGAQSAYERLLVVYSTVGEAANAAPPQPVWEYWNGAAWTALTVTDPSSAFTATAGSYSLTWTAPGNWATTTLDGKGPFFYVRLRSTGSGVYDNQLPVLDEIMLPKAAALVSKGSSAWELGLDASGKAVFTTAGVGGGTLTGGTELAPRTWTHVAGVWDGTTKWIFVNGEMDASASGLSGSVGLNDLAVRLGGSPTAAAAGFAGRLDEVRIWSGARTKELIAANAERTLTGHEPGLTAWFSFDHDNGLAVTDRKTPVNTNDQVTIDFENPDLQHDDNQTKRLPNNATYSNSKRYEEDTFRLDNLSAVSVFYTVGTKHHDYSGSTALYTNDQNGATRLTAIDGGLFRLRSITLHDFDNRPTGAIIPFTVTLENDLMIQRTLTFTGGGKPETFTFPDLLRIKAVEWKQAGGFYQFDDIIIQRSVAEVESRLATGKLVNMTDRGLDDGVSLGDAAPAEYALRFNGVDHYVEVPHAATLDLSSFTIEAWVRPEANGTTFRNILMKGQDGYGLALDQYGLLRYWVSGNSADALACTTITTAVAVDAAAGTNVAVQVADVTGLGIGTVVSIGDETNLTIGAVDPTAKTVTVTLAAPKASGEVVRVTPVSDGNWHHVAVSVDQTTNTTKLYVDGQPAGEHEQRTMNNNAGALVIGRQGINTAAGYFKGDLNELRIWDHVRSDAEIALLAGRQLVPGMTGLIGYWNLNDGVGLAAQDTSGNSHDAALTGSASEWEWVYGPQTPYRTGMYALTLDGVDDYLHVPHNAVLDATDVTIEAWIYPLANTTTDGYRTVVFKGEDGYNLAIDASGFISYWADVTAPTVLKSQRAVADGRWQHVAVVVDATNSATSFYIDGQPAGSVAGAVTVDANTDPLVIGRQGLTSATAKNHFKGVIDELRVWGAARTAAEIASLASRELASTVTGLLAYWRLNEGEGLTATSLVNDLAATLFNTDVSAWSTGQSRVDTDGGFWDTSSVGAGQNFSRQTSSNGLWIGRVVLNAVNEVQKATPTDAGTPAATADTASFRVVVHVDSKGIVRLLKHVTLMQRIAGQTANTVDESGILDSVTREIVLVSDDTKLPEFQGLIKRRGKLIGKRISTVGYDFAGNETELVGGLGGGLSLTGSIVLPRLHPTNPFRHKYHPEHRNVNPDNESYGYEIVRDVTFSFARPSGSVFESGGYGIDRLIGIYYEEVIGLHKVPVRVSGTVTLDRISTVAALNE